MLPTALDEVLREPERMVVAVSGGVDSLTLSAAAARARNGRALMLCHAVSPAVPGGATERVRRIAADLGVPLHVVGAGEFSDPNYLANPVNRCYFCKSNLYRTLSLLALDGTICAGTNSDDLGDYRPGLEAAREHGVRHPFVEAGMDKMMVRRLARALGLGDVAELPAAPCLASRIETGLRVTPEDLRMVDAVEGALRDALGNITLRCRRRQTGLAVEIDAELFADLSEARLRILGDIARHAARASGGAGFDLTIEPYRRGSAFLHA